VFGHDGYEEMQRELRKFEAHENELVREVLTYLCQRFYRIESTLHQVKEKLMSVQDQIDQETAKVTKLATDQATLITTTKDLVDEVKALKAQIAGGAVPGDFTKLDAAIDAAEAAVGDANTKYQDPGPQGSGDPAGG
jgi:chromosome segregation ATPase